MVLVFSFVYSTGYLLSTYSVPGTQTGIRDAMGIKSRTRSLTLRNYSPVWEVEIYQIITFEHSEEQEAWRIQNSNGRVSCRWKEVKIYPPLNRTEGVMP